MKRTITALILCTATGVVTAQSSASGQQRYDSLANELEIMSGVLNTSLRQNVTSDEWKVSSIETSYLVGQGAVFTFSVRGNTRQWISKVNGLTGGVIVTVPPLPPKPAVSTITASVEGIEDIEDIVFETSTDWEAFAHSYADSSSRRFAQAFSDNNEQLSDLRNMQREIAWEVREVERELRDISFELRHADEERAKELLKEQTRLKERLAKVEDRADDIKNELKTIEKERSQQLAQQNAEKQKAYKSFLVGFEGGMSDTLCRFGAGLRGLPDSEHISMVLKDFDTDTASRKRKDRIYVFTRADVVRCVQEKINADELLTNAIIYSF